ncbi:MAG: aspartate aminotransferase family protein [Anaerolineae bacterium]
MADLIATRAPAYPADRVATLKQAARDHLWMPFTQINDVIADDGPRVICRAEGCRLYDIEGRSYIDGVSALEAMVAGHGRRELLDAAVRQYEQVAFIDLFRYVSPSQIELAAKLAEITPGDLDRVFFTPGGGEAVEVAIKIARQYHVMNGDPSRYKVITRHGAYHGSNYGAMTVDGNYHATRNYLFQPESFGRIAPAPKPGCGAEHAREIEETILRENPATVSAVHLDPMNTALRVAIPDDEFLRELRRVCDRYGVLLIADEIITGFGRTGRMFAVEHSGIVPDLMTMSKGLSSGYIPIGATIVRKPIADAFSGDPDRTFRHGHTYSGHPVACAVALENIRVIERDDLAERAAKSGAYLLERLQTLDHHPTFGSVRGKGMLLGVELVTNKATGATSQPPGRIALAFRLACRDLGLILLPIHPGNVMLIAPPLNMEREDMDELVNIVDRALTRVDAEFTGV